MEHFYKQYVDHKQEGYKQTSAKIILSNLIYFNYL